jgi:riboflavin kinase/FMN adenylyltransferase
VTIGNFDGVHLGHASLIRRARDIVGPGGDVVALAFDPHPLSILRPDAAPTILSTFEQRAGWLRQCGADRVVRLEPTRSFLSQSPEDFIDDVLTRHPATVFVEGPDFHFGKDRAGHVDTLIALGKTRGFRVEVVPALEIALTDNTLVTASSSITRWLIRHGRVRDAACVLGRPYEIAGTVVQGDRRGRTIGFPTANLESDAALPDDGVYAAVAILPNDTRRPAAVHLGPRATFGDSRRTIEAHVLDWDGPVAEGAEEYGWPMRIQFIAWLRGGVRFESVHALTEQLHRDVERTRHHTAEGVPA